MEIINLKQSQIFSYLFLVITFSSCIGMQESDIRKKWNNYNSRASSVASSLEGEWDIISYQLNDVDAMDSVIKNGLNIPIAFGGYETGYMSDASDSYKDRYNFCLSAVIPKTLKDTSQECKTYYNENYLNRKSRNSCYNEDIVKNRKCLSYDSIQQKKFTGFYNFEGNAPYQNPDSVMLYLPLLSKSVYYFKFSSNGLELNGNADGIKYFIKLKKRPMVY